MRLFGILFLILSVSSEARKRRPGKTKPKINENKDQSPEQINIKPDHDLNTDIFKTHVPFGHIYKEGFEDPRSGFLRPVDLLEMDTKYIQDGPYAREFIKNHPRHKYLVLKKEFLGEQDPPLNFPGDGMSFQQDRGLPVDNKNDSIQPYWNMEALLLRNLAEPAKYRIGDGGRPRPKMIRHDKSSSRVDPSANNKGELLTQQYLGRQEKKYNFTTCDEFGKRAKFHPNDVVNLNWVPFYIWTNERRGRMLVSRVHQFTFPTIKFVNYSREVYTPNLSKPVDWEQPKLLLKYEMMVVLLIAVGRSGLFQAITIIDTPEILKNRKVSVTEVRLKIVDPYLVMMYCDIQYAVVMAVSGTEPRDPKKCISEASKLKIVGRGLPVARNLDLEAMEQRAKMEETLLKKENKFIKMEDDLDAYGSQLRN